MSSIFGHSPMGIFMEGMLHTIDENKKKRAKEDFGITSVEGLEGCERLSIPHIYDSIEVTKQYVHCHDFDKCFETIYNWEGKKIVSGTDIKYMKNGMFLVGNRVDSEVKDCGFSLYNEDMKLSEDIFKPLNTDMYSFNKEGFCVLGLYDQSLEHAIVNTKGEILYQGNYFDHLDVIGVIGIVGDDYFNLLKKDRICKKGYHSVSTDEFLFVEVGKNSVYQISKITGEYIIHGEPEKVEPPKVPYVKELPKPSEPKQKEQGRNDLCACGSGLKYKKCCQSKKTTL